MSQYPPHPQQPGQQPGYGWVNPGVNQGPPPAYPAEPQYPPPLAPTTQLQAMYGSSDAEAGFIDGGGSFSEKSIRLGFVRKVYGILSMQLLVTVGFIALFIYEPSVKEYTRQHAEMWWIAFAMTLVLIIVLACCDGVRRRWPLNIILLGLFTLCEGFMLGSVAALYRADDVLIAVAICAAVCFALMLFAMQTKWDFTAMGGILFSCCIVLFIFGIIAICMPGKVISLVYASLGALLFSVYLVFDTQIMLGGKHKYSISPEEYIFAALNLYLDIVNIFLYILAIVGGSRN